LDMLSLPNNFIREGSGSSPKRLSGYFALLMHDSGTGVS
jgi:hypothetical protein